MARTNNLTNFLTDVAGAIKTKKGSQTAIQAANFDTEILALPSQGTYQEKTVTITQNGQTTLTPDTGYDAMDQVEITVNVPIKQLQSKAVTITSNGNISILPDTGYDGFNEVNLQVNVPTGGGSGDVKLFETEQAMQADPNPQEGDLAVVYRDNTQPINGNSEFDSCIFPNEVVLDEAFTGSISGGFGATEQGVVFAATVEVSSSRFIFSDYVESEIIAQYTSQDGITYTRTDGGEELVEFGTTIKWESVFGPFNSIIGNFMKIGGMVFEGLYEYKTNQYVIAPTQLTLLADKLLPDIIGYGKNGITVGNFGTNVSTAFNDDVAKIYAKAQIVYNDMTPLVASNNNKRAGLSSDIVLVPCKSDGIPLLDTSSVTNMDNMFQDCKNLIEVSSLNTSNVTTMHYMFKDCTSLTTISQLDTSNVTNMSAMFSNCTSLSNESLNNVLAMCTNATSYTGTKTLKYIGINATQATTCQSLSNYSAFTAAGWTTGY